MIAHTTSSAAPSTSRQTLSQPPPRSPTTPGRYRSPPSLNQPFPSTPSSRRTSIVQTTTQDSSPSHSSTSNWQASIELSLTTRRRLIRKPLPQIPSSHLDYAGAADYTDEALVDSAVFDAQYQKAESWWPEALPEKHTSAAQSSSQPTNATTALHHSAQQHQPATNDGQGLDEQSLRHLLTILHYAALRYESTSTSTQGDGTIGRNVVVSATGTYKKQSASNAGDADKQRLYILDEATLDSLYRALQAAFRHLSQKQVLGALQRTASIRWRAEAQLRNATAAQAAETSSALSSRWARFAWPAAALGKAYKEAQRNVLPGAESSLAGSTSASRLPISPDFYAGLYSDPDHRIRKRDVAVKILSNAVWFVRNYGPVAGVETLQTSNGESEVKDALAPQPPSTIRRTSENLLKKNAGLPNFLSKSSATTALSGTATPESAQSDAPPTPTSEAPSSSSSAAQAYPGVTQDHASISASTSSQQLPRLPSTTATSSAETPSMSDPQLAATPSSETATANVNAAEKSKAMERLASLSAAAGAAMRQKAQQAADAAAVNGTKPEDAVDAAVAASSGTLHPRPSRQSLRSFASHSEAEAAETDALEKAGRDYLDKIGQGCDEWAKMVVCRLCASVSVAGKPAKGHRRRSGTLTARDFGQAAAAAEEADATASSISTRSDMTAKAGRVGHALTQGKPHHGAGSPTEDQNAEPIVWQADVFDGEELFVHHGTSSHDRRPSVSPRDEDERVRFVGGSFVCRVQTEKERQALVELLEIALYVGMSMLLESSFLSDSDAARPKIVKVPTRTTSTVDAPQRGASLVQQPTLSRASSQQSLESNPRSVSGSSSTMQTSQYTDPAAAADAANMPETDPAHSKPGSRKWTKSLWGMLGQHPHGSAEAGGHPPTARPGTSNGTEAASAAAAAPRTSLTMHRYHTEDDTHSLSAAATRKAIFKAGEEPKQSIAARKAALFAQSNNHSAPSTPQGGRGAGAGAGAGAADATGQSSTKPHRLVGRLMNAFARPSSSDAPRQEPFVPSSDSNATLTSSRPTPSTDAVPSQSRALTDSKTSNFQRLRIQAKPQPAFPVQAPNAAALTTSPELAMLLCYQYRPDPQQPTFPTAAYLTAFHRLQLLRFLVDQRREHSTFASPSHGISASGDLLPFVGVQAPSLSSSPWSVILSRGQQQQQQQQLNERTGTTSVQLLSYELLSRDGSALGLCREEVAFYQRLSNSRDVPLGQVIEELGIRACALEADGDAASKTSQDSRLVSGRSQVNGSKDGGGDASAGQRVNSVYGMPEQRLQFIHGSCRIKIVATVLPPRLCETETPAQPHAESEAEKGSNDPTSSKGSAAASPSLQPTRSRESDVSAIAAASHTNKEAANTAFAVAETAVQLAESGTSRPLVDQRGSGSASGIWMWNASAKSGWQGKATPMSESTYLLSFARYLEAISYHPALRRAAGLEPADAKAYGGLSNVQQQLRQGRSEDSRSIAEGPNLLRFFRSGRSLVKVQVQPLVLYDLQIQGPCLKTSRERRRERKQKQAQAEKRRFKQVAEQTRLEIQRFFASVKSNTTKLEDVFVSRELDEAGKTIRRKLPAQNGEASPAKAGALAPTSSSSSSTISEQVAEPLKLLTNLRSSLRSDEFELYEALQRTIFLDGINDVRKAFADRAKSAKNRLAAWTKKHLSKKEQADFGSCAYEDPEYFEAGRRAFPGSSFIVRDDEPLSIIAFSLSSRDFRAEMGTLVDRQPEANGYMGSSNEEHVKQWRSGVVDGGSDTTPNGSYISSSGASTATSTVSSLLQERPMRKVPLAQLDPDKDEVFFDAEPVRAALKRKKRGRESSILSLTLRRVGSTISESQGVGYRAMTANGRPSSSTTGSIKDQDSDDDDDDDNDVFDDDDDDDEEDERKPGKDGRSSVLGSSLDGQDTTLGGAPRTDTTPSRRPSATWMDQKTPSPSKPGMHTAGSVSALRRTFELRSQSLFSSIPDRKSSILQQPGQHQPSPRPGHSVGTSTISTTSTDTTFQAQITTVSGRPASLASIFSSEDPRQATLDSRINGGSRRVSGSAAPTSIPRSASRGRPSFSMAPDASRNADAARLSAAANDSNKPPRSATQPPTPSEGGIAGADAQSLISNSTLPGSHAAESPHIKHNLIHGNTKISCVSWFAEEFAALRERWGVEHDYVQSLSRCQPWVATGGKSKSAFFKTADEKFIAKQLLTVWSVDEKEAFLEFAPAYIRYMMNSAVNDCPTLLVKIAGVYSIKIKDIKTGETKLKMSVMLLENLWAGDGGRSVRFDLKGIRDRRVKLSAQQQQNLQQAATQAATSGQPFVDVPGAAKGTPAQGSATAALNAGVLSVAAGSESSTDRAASGSAAGDGGNNSNSTQTSPSRAVDGSKKAGEATAGGVDATASSATSSSGSSAVWWDSEWIERYRHRAFVPETQKELFHRALQNDTQFLTASNVMDYSLLLGVMERPVRQDDLYPPAAPTAGSGVAPDTTASLEAVDPEEAPERPSFRCRIVDFLGAFTLAKQLESSSKKALKGQDAKGNVTILPPSEYASRFLSAMDSYFIGTPCQPRLDADYGFDRMCDEVAAKATAAGGEDGYDADGVLRPRLASVL
ncbi:related to phosphatidylinositol 3-phosphate 5-kinase [Sporisorium reilianum f. sp. reilianum]|uniref:Related to phosphatidylinositol 3-phosphate 5-kinase n=1 Tax=Sporisorium reilianum f. sp. reilianum TaxID=72559 RepID=A0A2N8UPI2_9BASI|nr:related to phosphatidylinositol 3-phosphate 5-kinase [Sporisorium reilianum f. sp. reilianum]